MLQPILNRGYKFKELPKQTKIAVGNNSLVTPTTLEMVETWHARHWGHGGFRRQGGLVSTSLHNGSLATQRVSGVGMQHKERIRNTIRFTPRK